MTLDRLRVQALQDSLATPGPLAATVATMGFVQADPIRAPARAQDLILRHRVSSYRAGDLERRFTHIGLEEDFLYAYGFMPRATADLLHPRPNPASPDLASSDGRHTPSGLAAEVLAFVRAHGRTHPAELEAAFGRERAVNAWGGYSKATTRALQSLHYHGLLRVAGRRGGIRLYEPCGPRPDPAAPEERTRRLVKLVVRILAPVSPPSLRATFALLVRGAPGLGRVDHAVHDLLRSGELAEAEIDGERYLWPADRPVHPRDSVPRRVRFLAPFDPIVWDRRRFTHLWGWTYRFEAYTPAEKRQFGYYAMPLLWADRVIGWANLSIATGDLQVATGYAGTPPKSREFRLALDAEVARMATFLGGRAPETEECA